MPRKSQQRPAGASDAQASQAAAAGSAAHVPAATGCLKKTDDTDSHYSISLGAAAATITLLAQADTGDIQFTSQCTITGPDGGAISYQRPNSNRNLTFTAKQKTTYTLSLSFIFAPTSVTGVLTENCASTELRLPIMNGCLLDLAIAC